MTITPPVWTFVLTDMAANVIGEITNADARQVVLPLNRLPTASFKVPLVHPLAGTLLSLTADTMVKAYRFDGTSKKLAFFGPVLSVEEVADRDAQSLAINAVGPFWRVTKRFLGTTKNGIAFGTVGGLIEITQIARNIFDTVNSGLTGYEYTGISVGTVTYNSPNNMTKVGPYQLKNAAEAIAELAVSVNAFDYEVVPQEPASSGYWTPTIGQLNIIPYIGTTRPDIMFEYGGQANIVGYNRSQTRENIMNRGWITSPGWPDGTSLDLREQHDTPSMAARGLFEDVLDDGGVGDNNVRDAIVQEHLYWRKQPREIINITLAPNARPWIFTHFNVGDTVRARATVKGVTRFDAMFRVWGATMDIDKNGNETTTLELVMP